MHSLIWRKFYLYVMKIIWIFILQIIIQWHHLDQLVDLYLVIRESLQVGYHSGDSLWVMLHKWVYHHTCQMGKLSYQLGFNEMIFCDTLHFYVVGSTLCSHYDWLLKGKGMVPRIYVQRYEISDSNILCFESLLSSLHSMYYCLCKFHVRLTIISNLRMTDHLILQSLFQLFF